MKANEIIYTLHQHGLVFDMLSIEFNKEMCKEILKEDITNETKKQLFIAVYVNYFIQKATLVRKTNYGDSDVSFGSSVINIKKYIAEIKSKLKGIITKDEIDEYTLIAEDMLNLNDKEKEVSSNIVLPFIKQKLNIY